MEDGSAHISDGLQVGLGGLGDMRGARGHEREGRGLGAVHIGSGR